MVIVLIVSKTQMANGVCVGGIIEQSCELIRIHNNLGGNLRDDVPYEIGDRWLMDVQTAWNVRPCPHIEDKQTITYRKIDNVGVEGVINFVNTHNLGNRLVYGSIEYAFDGYLHFEGYKSFVNRLSVPAFSTQFWIADTDLLHVVRFDKHYFMYNNKYLRYVGLQPIIERIPSGTIIRLSLANWWSGDGSGEQRCYLQLSGWYLYH